jgi:chemotaxis signal transduction protein
VKDFDELMPYMRQVQVAERDLHQQTLGWTMIEASAAIGCPEHGHSILPTLSTTRERFARLQDRLVQALAGQFVGALQDDLMAAGQSTIDTLVRNLFERTADVGFLATDAVLGAFCSADEDTRDQQRSEVRARLQAYRDKYTVYDDVALLDTQGQVLVRLDAAPASAGGESWLADALAGRRSVEFHGHSALGAGAAPALLYAHRVDGAAGACVGVLVLRFRLVDEMERIFQSQTGARPNLALVLLDARQQVIQSSDPSHVAVDAVLQPMTAGRVALTTFGGREYLAMDCVARPYQGYAGPGWRVRAMVSLLVAFRREQAQDRGDGDRVSLDSGDLMLIQSEVDEINRNLRRVVWNGRLMAGRGDGSSGTGQASLKAVLHQVTLASERMRGRVDVAIQDLYDASVGRACRQASELARRATDLLDRNLYERANDCRWWALSPVLRAGLVGGDPAAMAQVLRDIHALYTVYRRLVVFDLAGTVCASSRPEDAAVLVGRTVPAAWTERVRGLSGSQHYAVSGFEPTALSDGDNACTYLARITHPVSGAPVGGIAAVFEAPRELRAMLVDTLDGRDGVAAFVDDEGRVLVCTDARWQPGPEGRKAWPVPLDRSLLQHDDSHHAQGVVRSSGYREYLRDDGHARQWRAVVMLRLGRVERRRSGPLIDAGAMTPGAHGVMGRSRMEIAVFQVGPSRFALSTLAVTEALPMDGLVRTVQGGGLQLGLLQGPGPDGAMLPVLCARRLLGLNWPGRDGDGVGLVLADPQRPDQPRMVLRVDEVGAVLGVEPGQVQDVPEGLRQGAAWLRSVVRIDAGTPGAPSLLVQWMDPMALIRMAGAAPASTGAGAADGSAAAATAAAAATGVRVGIPGAAARAG